MNNNMNQFNDQFTSATRQFADTAAQVNRLALDNAGQVFGLQMAAIEKNVNAAFAFWGELAETRDMDGLKALWPRGAQIARENVERTISTSQEVLGRTIKANEAIGQVAKGQFERSSAQVNEAANQVNDQVTKATNDATQQFKAAGKGNK
ncbi:phasin family protein [Cognatiluteimonas profundi]|uniref:phasin family protein n=1 Tax=Cognatiluteimonas profundi TaxID=2594501 RepID=UPI001E2C1CD1|nr:phasin family protein [Lysobacter profundi]